MRQSHRAVTIIPDNDAKSSPTRNAVSRQRAAMPQVSLLREKRMKHAGWRASGIAPAARMLCRSRRAMRRCRRRGVFRPFCRVTPRRKRALAAAVMVGAVAAKLYANRYKSQRYRQECPGQYIKACASAFRRTPAPASFHVLLSSPTPSRRVRVPGRCPRQPSA